jgi:hypothetical protein
MNAVVATMGKVIAMPARRSKAAARTKSATRKKTAARKKTVAVRRPAGRKKTAARKAATRRKPAAKKATTRKKAATRKATAKKATPRVSSRVASQPEMTPARRAATPSGRTAMPVSRASRPTMPAEPGDFILIDSPQVGSPPREGEVLEVIQGKVSVSYRVQWSDGHQTLIAPKGGTARIVRASERA